MTPLLRRTLVWILPVLLLVAGLGYAFRPQPVPVDMGTVTRGDLRVLLSGEGKTRVREIYVVSAPLAGEVLRIESEAGDAVVGDETVLATIEPTDPAFLDVRSRAQAEAEVQAAEAAVALAEAEVSRALAERDFARTDLNRARRLVVKENISQRALERAELDLKTSEAALKTARASLKVRRFELAMARARLIEPGQAAGTGAACCVNVKAPVSGRVLRVLHESQGVITPGTPLLEIGDLADLEVEVDLLSSDAVKVRPGMPVIIEEWGGGVQLSGAVRQIEPFAFTKVSALGIEEQRVNVMIDFAEPAERLAALGHGFRVDARIVIWQGPDRLKVPISALFRDGGNWAVFLDQDGTATMQTVSLGQLNALEAEVLDGLAEGDRIVLHPSDQVESGTPIVQR